MMVHSLRDEVLLLRIFLAILCDFHGVFPTMKHVGHELASSESSWSAELITDR
jgi:hypothetical protein